MDGKRFQKVENDRPIAKPSFPLPTAFSPSKRAEAATQPQRTAGPSAKQQAHFYRRKVTESGTPVYGFYISEGPKQDLRGNR